MRQVLVKNLNSGIETVVEVSTIVSPQMELIRIEEIKMKAAITKPDENSQLMYISNGKAYIDDNVLIPLPPKLPIVFVATLENKFPSNIISKLHTDSYSLRSIMDSTVDIAKIDATVTQLLFSLKDSAETASTSTSSTLTNAAPNANAPAAAAPAPPAIPAEAALQVPQLFDWKLFLRLAIVFGIIFYNKSFTNERMIEIGALFAAVYLFKTGIFLYALKWIIRAADGNGQRRVQAAAMLQNFKSYARVLYTIPITPGILLDIWSLVVGFVCSIFPFWTVAPSADPQPLPQQPDAAPPAAAAQPPAQPVAQPHPHAE